MAGQVNTSGRRPRGLASSNIPHSGRPRAALLGDHDRRPPMMSMTFSAP
jgi:hypothetical protein